MWGRTVDEKTKGAWLLAQSKNLDSVTGAGAARLENIAYAGKVGRLYNLLRRNIPDDPNPTVAASVISQVCQLNEIQKPIRDAGLNFLRETGRIDVAKNGAIIVLGATSTGVLECTAEFFAKENPTNEENAVLELSEKVAHSPLERNEASQYIGDLHHISGPETASLIDLCKSIAIIDEESERDRTILFNSNTFRDGKYAKKAFLVLETLSAEEKEKLGEVQEKLRLEGALYDATAKLLLGAELHKRLISVGFFDRMEVCNSTESVGYIASPNDFQKYGRPFEEDPIDDAKALLASLTYGRTRSSSYRGQITMPDALLRALINGREIGKNGIRAIGEDYKELEARQVVKVNRKGNDRYTMTLLKKDVGELALTIIRGGAAAQEVLLMTGSAATSFTGPDVARRMVRQKNNVSDKRFVAAALDRLRSGG
jgi:hypothetical protein